MNRPYQIIKRKIGDPSTDQVLYTDSDPTHYIDIGVSKDKKYLIFTCGHGSVRYIDRADTTSSDTVHTLLDAGQANQVCFLSCIM